MGGLSGPIQENLPSIPNVCQQPLEILNVPGERRMGDMGTNTSDVMIEATGSSQRPSCMETNAQPSIPIVDVLLPSGLGDHVPIPHVNLSKLGYESDSLRTSGLRPPSMRTQEGPTIPQLDGPGPLPMTDHTRGRVGGLSSQTG